MTAVDEIEETIMQARMANPALTLPGALDALHAVAAAATQGGLSTTIAEMVNLRASQINGCSVCVEMHARSLKKEGESDERIWGVAAWRDTPFYSDEERAALALTEAVTRLSDRADAVPDEVFEQAAAHFDEAALAGLILNIASINVWNRLNVATRQVAGAW